MVSWFGAPFQPLCPLFQSFPVCLAFEPCVPYIQEGWSFYILQNVHEAPARGRVCLIQASSRAHHGPTINRNPPLQDLRSSAVLV
ncbi:hypothetical protein QQF64_021721 [Cirrhinus molitorella]|uniref:Secreted protein n=1 Tax=Cirrhinus molitorella TaxID=172907 RepID=A0ABR3LA43_9TELE